MKRLVLLLAALGLVAFSANDPVAFVQPKSHIILAQHGGVEIPIQIRIEPNAENRSYRIEWANGVSARTLDGADDAALQPTLKIRVFQSQTIVASVFGPGGKLLYRAELPLEVCGNEGCQ